MFKFIYFFIFCFVSNSSRDPERNNSFNLHLRSWAIFSVSCLFCFFTIYIIVFIGLLPPSLMPNKYFVKNSILFATFLSFAIPFIYLIMLNNAKAIVSDYYKIPSKNESWAPTIGFLFFVGSIFLPIAMMFIVDFIKS